MPKGLPPLVRNRMKTEGLEMRGDQAARKGDVIAERDLRAKAERRGNASLAEADRVAEGRAARGLEPYGTLSTPLPKTEKLPKSARPTNMNRNMGVNGYGPGTGPSKARKNVEVVKELGRRLLGTDKAAAGGKGGFAEAMKNPELRRDKGVIDARPVGSPKPRPKAKSPKPRPKK